MNARMISLSLLAVAWLGCSKKPTDSAAPAGTTAAAAPGVPERPHVDGTPHTDDVVNAWQKAGLNPAAFTPIDPGTYRAGYCSQGTLGGIDALICEYTDDDALDRAKKLIHDMWNKEGVHTGVEVRTKRTLIAVADRNKADPNGKSIAKAVDTFKKL
jgi:hypothetical protein